MTPTTAAGRELASWAEDEDEYQAMLRHILKIEAEATEKALEAAVERVARGLFEDEQDGTWEESVHRKALYREFARNYLGIAAAPASPGVSSDE